MIVNATEFKTRAGKYLEIVEKEEIIITRNGRQVAMLIPIQKSGTPNADLLYGLLEDEKNEAMEVRETREERLRKKYESND